MVCLESTFLSLNCGLTKKGKEEEKSIEVEKLKFEKNESFSCSVMSNSFRLFGTPRTAAHQPLLSMEFSRQDY